MAGFAPCQDGTRERHQPSATQRHSVGKVGMPPRRETFDPSKLVLCLVHIPFLYTTIALQSLVQSFHSQYNKAEMRFYLLPTLALAAVTTLAAPTDLAARDLVKQCGQYQQLSNGPYTLYTNGWSWSSGQGNQCSSIWSRDGSRLTWSTSWSWSGTPTQVKSYTNVETNIQKKQLSQYKSMPTYWTWDYTGTDIRANGECIRQSECMFH